ncbi:hypothetical protein EJ04DRAFT_587743 [Polyplosphaeria fusca]|uniref:Uncharacterized protein n=1 Tax=Polyplosphaeria fusca TaxID=682080 RepID=A0A9P4QNW0_9PLEO|nr:hypothetical protein EJ04DRAFT_587743 [Polyplosphaeria fusca]
MKNSIADVGTQNGLAIDSLYRESDVKDFWGTAGKETSSALELGKPHEDQELSPAFVNKLSSTERGYLRGASIEELQRVMDECMRQANETQTRLESSSRKKHRVERTMTKFLSDFHSYVQAYSGVVELMNGAGPGYGSAAYGALSLFLVVALRNRNDNDRLEALRALLNISTHDPEAVVREYESLLTSTFDGPRRLPPLDVEGNLFAHPKFRDWQHNNHRSLLMVSGTTVAPDQTGLSWLSMGAVRYVTKFTKQYNDGNTILLQYFCKTSDSWGVKQAKIPLYTMLSSLIFQLVEHDAQKILLRDEDRFVRLKRDLEDVDTAPEAESSARARAQFAILRNIIAALAWERVIIVIDRVDRIQGGFNEVLEPLSELMLKARCHVKAFLTMRVQYSFDSGHVRDVLDERYVGIELNQDDGHI